jgi:hypothetical protein
MRRPANYETRIQEIQKELETRTIGELEQERGFVAPDYAVSDLLDATMHLYRTITGDMTSTPEEVALAFAREPTTAPLEHYSSLSGNMPSNGHILSGELPKKSVEEILAEL